MEINQTNFRRELLPILKHISTAAFVTFDLEMSGITTRPKHSSGDRSRDIGRQTLQQQYEEMKSAAETFQVLQVGITFVEEDREREYYLARPYNFNLSPLSANGVDLRLERTFQFSSSACDFLSRNFFDFGKVFRDGVPYLSREEEDAIREEYNSRVDKSAKIHDVVIPANEPTTLEFYRNARQEISTWTKRAKPELDFCNISSKAGPLNGYQRRLIHQLVRNEFPKLRVFARNEGSFMQVEKLDEKKEAEFQKKKFGQFQSLIGRQKGLRWVFEALVGGDLSDIDPEWFVDQNSDKPEDQLSAVKVELKEVLAKLRQKQHIIIGHNLFTDLGFLYKTFKGMLPNKVEHFQEDIHELFPVVIDTKYLATQGADSMNPRSNLKGLLAPFKKLHFPLILLHQKHTNYGASFGMEHEAGYDSWMTAELFVKLGAKLYAEHKQALGEVDEEEPISEEGDYIIFSDDESETDSSCQTSGGVSLFSPNPFSALDETPTKAMKVKENLTSPPGEYYAHLMNRGNKCTNKENDDDPDPPKTIQFLPPIHHQFWNLYANKLRVNGADTGVCDLAEGAEDDSLDSIE